MRSRAVLVAVLLFAGLSATACNSEAVAETPPPPGPAAVRDATLLFFLNPNGSPCRIQAGILEDIRSDVEKKANIRFVSVDNPADRGLFAQYGIRGLPSMILVDATGKELKRLPPGIQTPTTIRAAIDAL